MSGELAELVAPYFEHRRGLADSTMRMSPGPVLAEGDAVAQFVTGSATLGGEPVTWQTIGAYRADPERRLICEVWLVPPRLGPLQRIWSR